VSEGSALVVSSDCVVNRFVVDAVTAAGVRLDGDIRGKRWGPGDTHLPLSRWVVKPVAVA
jgi:hypothetical protein